MLNSKGFDLWADGYDRSVQISEEENTYPFAGYKNVLNTVYGAIRSAAAMRVLDVGIGTGVLAKRLYEDGYSITGVDFSTEMLHIAGEKMPGARLVCHDFSTGLPPQLTAECFDAVVCTYAIHHLTDAQKPVFIRHLLAMLAPGGLLLIGDVAFHDRAALERCRTRCGQEWDDEEFYPVAQELQCVFPELHFEQISFCAGVFALRREE